ncbi:MAG TPA: outer membrane beta-barrel protein [Thermoanaerobaculia bacterium]
MKKSFHLVLCAVAFSALPLAAQDWSISAGSGPFVFGDFMERSLALGPPEGPGAVRSTVTLTAGTRAGLIADIERSFADRWAVRLEGTFTRAPLTLGDSDDGFELEAGDLDVMTFALPLVFRINPEGTFRFYLKGGPANAIYEVERSPNAARPIFDGTRNRWGVTAGAGVGWHFSEQFVIEGQISDVVTSSPFERGDFAGGEDDESLDIPRPHNIHTSVGVRWRF